MALLTQQRARVGAALARRSCRSSTRSSRSSSTPRSSGMRKPEPGDLRAHARAPRRRAARRGVRVRRRPRDQLRGRAGARDDGGPLRARRPGDPRAASQRSPSSAARPIAQGRRASARRSRPLVRAPAVPRPTTRRARPARRAATRARRPGRRPARAGRPARASAALAWRAVASQPATEDDSCSISSAGSAHTADQLVEARPLLGELLDPLVPAAGVVSIGRSVGTTRSYCSAGDRLEERLAIGEVLEHRALRRRPRARRSPRRWASGRPRRAGSAASRPAPGACARRGPCGRRAARRWRPSAQHRSAGTARRNCTKSRNVRDRFRGLDELGSPGLLILETRTERKERSQRL